MKNKLLILLTLLFSASLFSITYDNYKDMVKLLTSSIATDSELLNQTIKSIKDNSSEEDKHLYEKLLRIVQGTDLVDGKVVLSLDDLKLILNEIETKYPDPDESEKIAIIDLYKNLLGDQSRFKRVALIGHTRGGKSTFISTMVNPLDHCLFERISNFSLFSFTINPEKLAGVFTSASKQMFAAIFVDTPGVAEIKADSNIEARSDEEIIALIVAALEKVKVDNAFLIAQLSGPTIDLRNFEHLLSFKKAFQTQSIYSGAIDLLIPRADEISALKINSIKDSVSPLAFEAKVSKEDFGKILFTGTIFNKTFKNGELETTRSLAETIFRHRNDNLAHIFGEQFSEGINKEGSLESLVDSKIRQILPLSTSPKLSLQEAIKRRQENRRRLMCTK